MDIIFYFVRPIKDLSMRPSNPFGLHSHNGRCRASLLLFFFGDFLIGRCEGKIKGGRWGPGAGMQLILTSAARP
jgi:hypothetical protein